MSTWLSRPHGGRRVSFRATATQQFLALECGPRGSCHAPGTSVGALESKLLSDTLLSTFFIFILKIIKDDQLRNEITLGSPAGETQTDHGAWGYAGIWERQAASVPRALNVNCLGLHLYHVPG